MCNQLTAEAKRLEKLAQEKQETERVNCSAGPAEESKKLQEKNQDENKQSKGTEAVRQDRHGMPDHHSQTREEQDQDEDKQNEGTQEVGEGSLS